VEENARVVQRGIQELERRSAEEGQPVTVQRRAALKALVLRSDHPTAEAVYADVVAELPGISKATVYRALDNLVQLGLARRVHHEGSVARYDGNGERHHHLVCRSCGKIEDVSLDLLDSIPVPKLAKNDFEVHDVLVSFEGVCRDCKSPQSFVRRRSK
jgi:Fe2+ or Zn2+ uptake regulation protein